MRKILLISLMILAISLVGCEVKTEEMPINSGETQVELNNNEENALAGRTFKISLNVEPDFIDCSFSFDEDDVRYCDDFGMDYKGTYEINNDIIDIILLSHDNEYSPSVQPINVEVQLKMVDKDKLEVLKTPDSFILKTSIPGKNGWEYDGGEKETTFAGIKQGYQFTEVK